MNAELKTKIDAALAREIKAGNNLLSYTPDLAQAALQAIKDAGYVIVPKEPGTEGAAKPLPDDQGWIQHRGAEQPVPDGVRVDLRLSDGSVVEGVWSDDWGWDWGETDPQILAYRASQREGDGK